MLNLKPPVSQAKWKVTVDEDLETSASSLGRFRLGLCLCDYKKKTNACKLQIGMGAKKISGSLCKVCVCLAAEQHELHKTAKKKSKNRLLTSLTSDLQSV